MPTFIPTLIAQLGEFTPPGGQTKFTDKVTDGGTGVVTNVEAIISMAIGVLTVLGGIFFIFNFVTASLDWINSQGESGKLQTARQKMVQSAAGLAILVVAYTAVGVIGTVIGIDILDLTALVQPLIP